MERKFGLEYIKIICSVRYIIYAQTSNYAKICKIKMYIYLPRVNYNNNNNNNNNVKQTFNKLNSFRENMQIFQNIKITVL